MYGSSNSLLPASIISQTETRPKLKDKLFQYFLDLSMKMCAYLHDISIIDQIMFRYLVIKSIYMIMFHRHGRMVYTK